MKSQQHGQPLPDSSIVPADPTPGTRYNFRSSPRGYLVPVSVAANPKLSDGAKLMWGVIRQLQFEDGCCYASDDYLAARLAVAARTARRYCQELRQEGLMEDVRRLGRPSMRFLLWTPAFKSDRRGKENPGPDDGQNGPAPDGEDTPTPRPNLDASMANSGRLNGQIQPSYPNYLNGVPNGVLSNNNKSPFETPSSETGAPDVPVVVAQKGRGRVAPEGSGKTAQMVAELRTRGVLEVTARNVVVELPEDFPFLDALDFYQHQATAPGSRIKNAPGFIVTMLQGRILPPANWETRAQRAARERDERERAELDARQMDLDLQAEAQLDAAADAKVAELKTVAPAKYAELIEKGKAHLAEHSPSARRELESRSFGPMLRGQVEQCVWAIVRNELRAQHYNRKSLPAETV